MKSERFYKYLEVCFDRSAKSLKDYLLRQDTKLLFRFRVEIKKIRACLKCIEFYKGKKGFQKTRAHFRKIFSEAGCLRELKIYMDWFRRHHLLQVAKLIHLEEQIKEKHVRFSGHSDKIQGFMIDTRKYILGYAAQNTQEQVFRFYILLLQDRLQVLRKELEKGNWHKIRKQFKLVLYARHWQDEKGQRVLSKTQAIFLDQLQHLIGFWHDNEIMMNWLKAEQKKSGNKVPSSKGKNTAYEKAFQLMEAAREKLKAKVIAKSKLSNRVLKPLSHRLKKIIV